MNTVCDTPSVYSCAIDSFIELCFYNLFPVLNNLFPYMTNFCHLIYDCSQKYKLHISAACPQMNIVYELLSIEVRQPIWEVIQTNCISFRARDCNAEFSEIFRQAVFGELNDSEVGIFVSRYNFEVFCDTCNLKMPQSAETFLYYVNCPEFISEEFLTQWPSSLSDVKNDKRCCPQSQRDVENLNYTIEPAVVLFIEFSCTS